MPMVHKILSPLIALTIIASPSASASEEGLSSAAPLLWNPEIPFWQGHTLPISNSLVMLSIAVLLITLVLSLATRKMQMIPSGLQNFVEWIFESLYNFVESLIGKKLAGRYFWYFSTVFLLIIVSNYMGLIPGVGEITFDGKPLLRGANADLNITVFLGFSYAILWFIWVMREQGPVHFIKHTFGVKGGMTGMMKNLLHPIFLFVGIIEIVSICIRPIALSARLYGNIFAGESILEKMSLIHWGAMLPFMGLEILVGFVQALVFLMLTAIFLKTQVGDDEEASHN